jgi:hypothetical protein
MRILINLSGKVRRRRRRRRRRRASTLLVPVLQLSPRGILLQAHPQW